MTFHKYLVTFGMLMAGWSSAWAADDTPASGASASDADASATSSTATHKSAHHKKHHGAKSAATTGIPGDATATSSASASPTPSTTAAATPATTKKEAKLAPAASAAPVATTTADANTPAASKKHHHKGAKTDATATGSAATIPPTASAASPTPDAKTPASPSLTPAAAPATAATATQPTGSHRHHGKTTEPASTTAAATPDAGTIPPAAPATASAPTPASAPPSKNPAASVTPPATTTPVAPGATVTPTTTATTGTSSHHRRHHGKNAAPEPIVGTPPVTTPGTPTPPVLAPAVVVPTTTPAATANVVPTVETGLPVARPGAGTTATMPVGAGHGSAVASLPKFNFTDYPGVAVSRRPTRSYPWKTNIITTVFWIGEGGSALSSTTNIQSAWDMNWIHHNGGTDDPDDMSKLSGYSSLTHASTLNPFYIALPFNDLAYPDKAQRWLPPGWYKPQRHGQKPISACQGRWVEIKNRRGLVCYAQWEDVGPLVSDHAEYVFGPERPDTLTRAGLDVSPAVAKYLGIDSTAMTSWRFVDDADVQPGMWLRYDEQAILFRALKEQMHPSSSPRIQDLSEPVPDGSAQDASEKRAGAARG